MIEFTPKYVLCNGTGNRNNGYFNYSCQCNFNLINPIQGTLNKMPEFPFNHKNESIKKSDLYGKLLESLEHAENEYMQADRDSDYENYSLGYRDALVDVLRAVGYNI